MYSKVANDFVQLRDLYHSVYILYTVSDLISLPFSIFIPIASLESAYGTIDAYAGGQGGRGAAAPPAL